MNIRRSICIFVVVFLIPAGPLAEVTLPVDSLTKKVKGFAHVVFMFPEHALKAYTDCDYKSLHGRLMHILPGREPKEADESDGLLYLPILSYSLWK